MSSRRGVQQEGKTPEMSATDVLDFKALVGTVVEVRFKDSRQVKAEVFAYDSTARMVVLQERLPQVRRRNINVVRDTFISSIKVGRLDALWLLLCFTTSRHDSPLPISSLRCSHQVLGREERTDLSRPLPAIQYKYLTERENRALRKAQSAVASKGVGVSDRAQRVFDQFAKTSVVNFMHGPRRCLLR